MTLVGPAGWGNPVAGGRPGYGIAGAIPVESNYGQNDPADIPALVALLEAADMVVGIRTGRRDSFLRRAMSKFANAIRGRLLDDRLERVDSLAWAADNATLFYTQQNAAKRPDRAFRHALGTKDDALVWEERDELFNLGVGATRSDAFVVLVSASKDTSEVRVVPAADPRAAPRRIAVPRVMTFCHGLEKSGAQSGCEAQCHEHRERHRRNDGDGKLAVNDASGTTKEGHGDEHGGERECNADQRRRDLCHRFAGGLLRRQAFLGHDPLDVLHHHDGVVHHDTNGQHQAKQAQGCLLYTSPSPRDRTRSRMPSSA